MARWPTLAAAMFALAACTANETPPEAADSGAAAGGSAMTTPAPDATRLPEGGTLGRPDMTPAQPEGGPDTCGASKVRELWIGAALNDEIKAGIARAVGDRPIRYYGEGDAVTMDYSEARLNVVLGKDGRISEFSCG